MTSTPLPLPPSDGRTQSELREKIARVIDADAWKEGVWEEERPGDLKRAIPVLQARALTKADAILALSASPQPDDGWGEGAGVYGASRASVLERGAMWRQLRSEGYPIISSWIDEDGPKASRDLSGLWVRIVSEIARCERVVLYVEPADFPLKGAFIEVGIALAAGVPIVVVAPGVVIEERNCRPLGSWIKHPLVTFADTVEEAFAHLPPPSGRAGEGEGKQNKDLSSDVAPGHDSDARPKGPRPEAEGGG